MLSKIFSTGIILLSAITLSFATSIDGYWTVKSSNDMVEIQRTSYGLKAKFVDSYDWVTYDKIYSDVYEDQKGNRYYVRSRKKITWESRDGRRKIQLSKSNYRNDRNYDEYNYRRGRSHARGNEHICSATCGCTVVERRFDDGISGTYTNRRRNVIAYVEYNGYTVRMKTNRAPGWITYYRSHSRKLRFEDRWGNELKFRRNGDLEWERRGRRDVDLRRN